MVFVIEDERPEGADVEQEPEAEAEAEDQETEDEPESQPGEDENLKEKTEPGEFQSRLNKLTRNWRETQRALEQKDTEIAELLRQLAEKPKEREPEKTLADFDYDNEKYLEYRLEKVESEATRKAEELMTQFQGKTEAQMAFGQFKEREQEFSKHTKDYHQVVSPENWACSQLMASQIHKSDVGPDLAYHLAKNPDIAMELYNLSDLDAVRRLALLEVEIKSERAKVKPKKVSDAPPPPPKIKAGDPGIETGYREGMSDKEFDKLRRKEIANR